MQMETDYAQQAQADGNSTIASVFTSIKGDEHGHRQTFTTEYQELTGTQP